jgi:hypothetical protein
LESKIKTKLPEKFVPTSTENSYRPELVTIPYLSDQEANYLQSLIGVLQWIVRLGRIDIAFEVSTLAQHLAAPLEGHYCNAIHIFTYLKHHLRSPLVMDHRKKDLTGMKWTKHDWSRY